MNPVRVYYFMMFILLGISMISIPITDYVYPGFYNYDMCSKEYIQSQSHGEKTIYDRPNSQELIKACYDAKNMIFNPLLQSIVVFGFAYVTIRYMVLGPKNEFVKRNPSPKWRWESVERRSPI